jgi:hypothetical protein
MAKTTGKKAKEPKVDFSKPVQTRDGRKVEIKFTDGRDSHYPICGYIEGDTFIQTWTSDGYFSYNRHKSPNDLVNVPEKPKPKTHKFYVNAYRDSNTGTPDYGIACRTYETSVLNATMSDGRLCSSYLTTLEIEWTEDSEEEQG